MSCFKAGHRNAAKEFIDDEFAHKLLKRVEDSKYTDKEAMEALDFLHKLNSEYYKNVIKKDDPQSLHSSKRLRRDCYARENARNRDIMSVERHKVSRLERRMESNGDVFFVTTVSSDSFDGPTHLGNQKSSHEDTIIDLLDGKMLAMCSEEIEN